MQLPNAKFAAITSCNVSLKLSTPENFFNQPVSGPKKATILPASEQKEIYLFGVNSDESAKKEASSIVSFSHHVSSLFFSGFFMVIETIIFRNLRGKIP